MTPKERAEWCKKKDVPVGWILITEEELAVVTSVHNLMKQSLKESLKLLKRCLVFMQKVENMNGDNKDLVVQIRKIEDLEL